MDFYKHFNKILADVGVTVLAGASILGAACSPSRAEPTPIRTTPTISATAQREIPPTVIPTRVKETATPTPPTPGATSPTPTATPIPTPTPVPDLRERNIEKAIILPLYFYLNTENIKAYDKLVHDNFFYYPFIFGSKYPIGQQDFRADIPSLERDFLEFKTRILAALEEYPNIRKRLGIDEIFGESASSALPIPNTKEILATLNAIEPNIENAKKYNDPKLLQPGLFGTLDRLLIDADSVLFRYSFYGRLSDSRYERLQFIGVDDSRLLPILNGHFNRLSPFREGGGDIKFWIITDKQINGYPNVINCPPLSDPVAPNLCARLSSNSKMAAAFLFVLSGNFPTPHTLSFRIFGYDSEQELDRAWKGALSDGIKVDDTKYKVKSVELDRIYWKAGDHNIYGYSKSIGKYLLIINPEPVFWDKSESIDYINKFITTLLGAR